MNQETSPACVGYAAYHWLDAEPIRQRPMHPNGIYELAKNYDEWEGTQYDGTSIRGAMKVLKLTGHAKEYRFTTNAQTAAHWILEKGPVILGANWYFGMMQTDSSGFVHAHGSLMGGHAVTVFGVNLKDGFFFARNSWGAKWGDVGDFRISISDFQKLLNEDGEVCTATEVGYGQSWPL